MERVVWTCGGCGNTALDPSEEVDEYRESRLIELGGGVETVTYLWHYTHPEHSWAAEAVDYSFTRRGILGELRADRRA
jgi:hypothetical protein